MFWEEVAERVIPVFEQVLPEIRHVGQEVLWEVAQDGSRRVLLQAALFFIEVSPLFELLELDDEEIVYCFDHVSVEDG